MRSEESLPAIAIPLSMTVTVGVAKRMPAVFYAVFSVLCLLLYFATTAYGADISGWYWKRPVPFQGISPEWYGNLGISLYPEDCGKCHVSQYREWRDSLHSMAIGPGIKGQLAPYSDPSFAGSCYICHAPLSEQQEVLDIAEGYAKNLQFDERLKASGVNCAVCHLRGYKKYGPPSPGRLQKSSVYGGFIPSPFFESSGFCAPCHQFPEDGNAINGKLLENTYIEWLESPYPAMGVTCQSCHMPERRHYFRGIHDPGMVSRGLEIVVKRMKIRGVSSAVLTIKNSGVGHYFPTYVTPLVTVRAFVVNREGVEEEGSRKEEHIGRIVTLDLSRELADTRIPPRGEFIFDYKIEDVGVDAKLVMEVWVYPDEFYNRFFKAALEAEYFTSEKEMKEALEETEKSKYLLFRKEISRVDEK